MVANSSHYHCLAPVPSVKKQGQSVKDRLKEMDEEQRGELMHWMWTAKCAAAKGMAAWAAIGRGSDQQGLDRALSEACSSISGDFIS